MNVLVERPSPAIKTGDLCPDDSENCRFHPLWRYARLAPPENPLRAHPTARERPDSGDSDSKRRAIWGIPVNQHAFIPPPVEFAVVHTLPRPEIELPVRHRHQHLVP
jgi:hypothetical protein